MQQVNLKEAATQLADVIEAAASGKEVVITHSDSALFQIIPSKVAKPHPKLGSGKSLVRMSGNFDALSV